MTENPYPTSPRRYGLGEEHRKIAWDEGYAAAVADGVPSNPVRYSGSGPVIPMDDTCEYNGPFHDYNCERCSKR